MVATIQLAQSVHARTKSPNLEEIDIVRYGHKNLSATDTKICPRSHKKSVRAPGFLSASASPLPRPQPRPCLALGLATASPMTRATRARCTRARVRCRTHTLCHAALTQLHSQGPMPCDCLARARALRLAHVWQCTLSTHAREAHASRAHALMPFTTSVPLC